MEMATAHKSGHASDGHTTSSGDTHMEHQIYGFFYVVANERRGLFLEQIKMTQLWMCPLEAVALHIVSDPTPPQPSSHWCSRGESIAFQAASLQHTNMGGSIQRHQHVFLSWWVQEHLNKAKLQQGLVYQLQLAVSAGNFWHCRLSFFGFPSSI